MQIALEKSPALAEVVADTIRGAAVNAGPTPGNPFPSSLDREVAAKGRGDGSGLPAKFHETTKGRADSAVRVVKDSLTTDRLVNPPTLDALQKEIDEARLMLDPDGWSAEAVQLPKDWPL